MTDANQLHRHLRLFDATTIVVGSMIGSGIFIALSIMAAVYRLRFKQPQHPRPYRCWGYPVTPALYLAICLAFLVYVVQGDPPATTIGLLLVLTGIPFYVTWKNRRQVDLNGSGAGACGPPRPRSDGPVPA